MLVALVALVLLVTPAPQYVLALANWFKQAGARGIACYVALYAIGSLLVAPGSALTLLAGFAYGTLPGFAIALPAASVAAWLNFLFARYVGHDWVERTLARDSRWRRVRDAAAQHGFVWVVLLRLSPVVPFAVLNYLMGVSQIRQRDFVVASALGKAPSTLAYVYVGSALQVLTTPGDDAQNPWTEGLFWVGLAATVTVAVQLTRVIKRRTETLLVDERGPAALDSTPDVR